MATKKTKSKSKHPAKAKKPSPSPERYPRCKAFGLKVCYLEDSWPFIPHAYIEKMRADKGAKFSARFHELYGVQTCHEEGLYPHDVEAVLERMESGRCTGSQALWD